MTERKVLLKIRTEQQVPGEPPEIMELQSLGTLRQFPDRTEITYEESEMTGLEGVVTTFTLYGSHRMLLTRDGEKLKNKMDFQVGQKTDSLYDVGFGALLVSITTKQVKVQPEKGKFFVEYNVEVEHAFMGTNTYDVTYRYIN